MDREVYVLFLLFIMFLVVYTIFITRFGLFVLWVRRRQRRTMAETRDDCCGLTVAAIGLVFIRKKPAREKQKHNDDEDI